MKNIIFFVVGCILASVVFFAGVRSNPVELTPTPGAATGPDSYFPCESHNGSVSCFNRKPLTVATTTVCAIQSPNATSTLRESSGVTMRVSSTTAGAVVMTKSANPYATTTLIGQSFSFAANGLVDMVASTTIPQQGAGVNVFAPLQWFVVGMSGGKGTFSPSGFCHADFDVL